MTHDSQEASENQVILHTPNRGEVLKHIEQNLQTETDNLFGYYFFPYVSLDFLLHLPCPLKGLMNGLRNQFHVSETSILVSSPVHLMLHVFFLKNQICILTVPYMCFMHFAFWLVFNSSLSPLPLSHVYSPFPCWSPFHICVYWFLSSTYFQKYQCPCYWNYVWVSDWHSACKNWRSWLPNSQIPLIVCRSFLWEEITNNDYLKR